jgi:hypothetical protein
MGAACRYELPAHDLGAPSDLASPPRDLAGAPPDMQHPPADLAMAADMKMASQDLAPPPGDGMTPPPSDGMAPPDLPPPSDGMAPDDGMASSDDMTAPGTDMMTPTDDMPKAVDLAGADLVPAGDPTEFIVLRVGDGASALGTAATAAFLERRRIADGSLSGTPTALPTTVSGANRRLTLGGTTTSEGALSRSADGHYVLLGGYDAAVGTAHVSGSMSSMVSRVIGRLDAAGGVDTSTAADYFSANSLRSVTSTDGSSLWAAGASGVVHTTLGSTTAPAALLSINMRWVHVFAGQLYGSSSAGSYHGINQLGSGTPTGTTTAMLLSGFSAQPMTSHYGFVALDRDGMAGIDVIYVADDRAAASGGGVQRWTLSGATWNLDGTLKKGLGAGARGVTGLLRGSSVLLLVTTAESPPRVVSFLDDGSGLDMIAAQPLSTAAANTAYRGIALAPQ